MQINLMRLVLVVALMFAFQVNAAASKDKIAQIEQHIDQVMTEFQVPGVAIAIVKDGEVLLQKGYGVTNIETGAPVNEKTLFGIASNTKAMTAALLAQLVDQGKISWQTKVTDIIPEFQMPDAYVTRQFTIIDLLAHNSGLGLGAGDLMIWPHTDHSIEDIIKGIRYLPEESSFRSEFAYDNLMYIIAGEVISRVTNKPWSQVIQEQIFDPLGMSSTRPFYSMISPNNTNVANAHVPLNDKLNVVGGNFLEKFAAAGSVASNVKDMSAWLKAILNEGQYAKDKSLFSKRQSYFMWQPKTLLPVSKAATRDYGMNFYAYGLGWFLNDIHGYKMVHHSGGILGMVSKVVLVPEEKLGIVVLTNQQSGSAFNAIYRGVLQQYLDIPKTDWLAFYKQREAKYAAHLKEQSEKQSAARDTASKPSLPIASYANVYRDDWYGDIEITLKDGQLHMQFSRTKALVGVLEHFQHNTFIVRWNDRMLEADAYVNFHLNEDGTIKQATMKAVSDKTDFSFDFHDLTLKIKK